MILNSVQTATHGIYRQRSMYSLEREKSLNNTSRHERRKKTRLMEK